MSGAFPADMTVVARFGFSGKPEEVSVNSQTAVFCHVECQTSLEFSEDLGTSRECHLTHSVRDAHNAHTAHHLCLTR